MASVYLDPLTDFGFKRLFGTESNKDLLVAFLNAILPNAPQIVDLVYLPTHREGELSEHRQAVLDVRCRTADGSYFNVEMQRILQTFFLDRSIFYSSFQIRDQAPRGSDWNFELPAIYTVAILDFVLEGMVEMPEVESLATAGVLPDYYHLVQLRDQRGRLFYDKLTYLYVELPKFSKSIQELHAPLDPWLYTLRNLVELKQRPEALQGDTFKKLFDVAEVAALSKDDRAAYEQSLKERRDYYNTIESEGLRRELRGERRGEARGEARGEVQRAKRNALAMLVAGVALTEVVIFSGLTETEIFELAQEHQIKIY